MDMHPTPQRNAMREAYYARIGQDDMAPLWEVLKNLVPAEPKSSAVPRLWRYDAIRSLLLESGSVISAEEAERRVLVLENPAWRGKSRITPTLYAGLQLILPGEVARAHRHVAAAIRFIQEGEGAYTAVDGERTAMHPGDFVITPSWTWHDHGCEGTDPVIWLDGLDLPIVNFFESAFLEHHDEEIYPQRRPQDDAMFRYAQAVLPMGVDPDTGLNSPIINYPYSRTREVLHRMSQADGLDPVHGFRVRYTHPKTGGWATPTMGGTLALLPKGFEGQSAKQTDGTVYVCVEGRGRTEAGDQVMEWGPRDVFVVPNWTRFRHVASEESVLFALSDRPAQERLGIWREARAA